MQKKIIRQKEYDVQDKRKAQSNKKKGKVTDLWKARISDKTPVLAPYDSGKGDLLISKKILQKKPITGPNTHTVESNSHDNSHKDNKTVIKDNIISPTMAAEKNIVIKKSLLSNKHDKAGNGKQKIQDTANKPINGEQKKIITNPISFDVLRSVIVGDNAASNAIIKSNVNKIISSSAVPAANKSDLSKIGSLYNKYLGKPAGLGKKYSALRLECSKCYAQISCPHFTAGNLCYFKDWKIDNVDIKKEDGVKGYINKMEGVIKVMESRLYKALYFENEDGGVPDPDLDENLERMFLRYKELLETVKEFAEAGSDGSNTVKSDILAKIFASADDSDENETELTIKKKSKKAEKAINAEFTVIDDDKEE